jgi:hypothetical protein
LPGRGYEALWEAREKALAFRARMHAREDAIAKTGNRPVKKDASSRIVPDKTATIL